MTKVGQSPHGKNRVIFAFLYRLHRRSDEPDDAGRCLGPVPERGRPRVHPSGGLRRAGGGCGCGAGGGRGVGGATWPCVPGGGCDAVPHHRGHAPRRGKGGGLGN